MLTGVLRRFEEIQRQYADAYCNYEQGKFDLAYSYNERASISILAGAIWRENPQENLVLEEYSCSKERAHSEDTNYKGRRDLWFRLGDIQYRCEAKQKWLDLESVKQAEIDGYVALAESEAGQIDKKFVSVGQHALGIVFVTLRIKRKNRNNAEKNIRNLNNLIQNTSKEELLIYPIIIDKVLTAGGTTNSLYPGIIVFFWLRTAQKSPPSKLLGTSKP